MKTLDDVLAALNGASGFDGARDGLAGRTDRLVVTDAAGGASQLALSIVAHNEGGGTLDFGDFDLTTFGPQARDRERHGRGCAHRRDVLDERDEHRLRMRFRA